MLPWSNKECFFFFLPVLSFPTSYHTFGFCLLEFVLCSFQLLCVSSFSTLLPPCRGLDFNIRFNLSLLPPQFAPVPVCSPIAIPLCRCPTREVVICQSYTSSHDHVCWHHHFCGICSRSRAPSTTVFPYKRPWSTHLCNHTKLLFPALQNAEPTPSWLSFSKPPPLSKNHSSYQKRTVLPPPAPENTLPVSATSLPPLRRPSFRVLWTPSPQSPLQHSFINHPPIFPFLLY